MASGPADDTGDIPVLLEDQEKINEFSYLNAQFIEDEEKLSQLKEEIQQLKDAQEETLICMDSSRLLLKVGDAFVSGTETEAEAYCQSLLVEREKELSDIQAVKESLEARMATLKAALYAKFGSKRINLDIK